MKCSQQVSQTHNDDFPVIDRIILSARKRPRSQSSLPVIIEDWTVTIQYKWLQTKFFQLLHMYMNRFFKSKNALNCISTLSESYTTVILHIFLKNMNMTNITMTKLIVHEIPQLSIKLSNIVPISWNTHQPVSERTSQYKLLLASNKCFEPYISRHRDWKRLDITLLEISNGYQLPRC